MDAIQEHQQKLTTAFAEVLRAEDEISAAKRELDDATFGLQTAVTAAETRLVAAWDSVKALMEETGEVEVILAGEVTDFKIAYSTPRETVKVEPEAVPEEFCKMERKPRLKEIGEYLKGLRDAKLDFPNWASFQTAKAKLGWKAIKRNNSTR
jgi:hypothetical protein